jgi:dihydrofolate reductase
MQHGLIDEYRLWIYPVVLGDGRRLFRQGGTPSAFKLVEARTTSTGVVVHVYRAAGKPTYGTIDIEQVDQGRRVDPTVGDTSAGS